ncbi:MAG TPA: hypothetical protein VLF71_00280 [Candidatus Saccharimonadales bacterium]|nr:hypothetical protein [Candidatus Saccharimonadales bacterium]
MKLHHFYGNVRAQAEAAAERHPESPDTVLAAQLIMEKGMAFSDRYQRYNRASTLVLPPADIDPVTGAMPLVGLDLSRVTSTQAIWERDPEATLCPAGWEGMLVADWYVSDVYLMSAVPEELFLGGFSREAGSRIIGETALSTGVLDVVHATRIALLHQLVPGALLPR